MSEIIYALNEQIHSGMLSKEQETLLQLARHAVYLAGQSNPEFVRRTGKAIPEELTAEERVRMQNCLQIVQQAAVLAESALYAQEEVE